MKNTIRRGLCLLLLLAMTAAMAACGQKNANTNTDGNSGTKDLSGRRIHSDCRLRAG